MHCSAASCPAAATVIYTARGGAAGIHRAAASCDEHRRDTRRWVAGAGPAIQETPLALDANTAPSTLF